MYKARINFTYKGIKYKPGDSVTQQPPVKLIKMGVVDDVLESKKEQKRNLEVHEIKKSGTTEEVTFVSLICRPEVLDEYFKNILEIDMPRNKMAYLVFIDSDNKEFINRVKNNVVRFGFSSIKIIMTHDEPVVNSFSFYKRGMRIAMHIKKIIEEIKTPLLFMVEDDTLVPKDAYRKLHNHLLHYPNTSYVTGVEVSRGPTRHLGITHVEYDDNGEIVKKINPRPKKQGIERISGGGWYCWMGVVGDIKNIEYRCSDELIDERQIGPDVYFVSDISRKKVALVDWSIWCEHYDGNSKKWLTPDDTIYHEYNYHKEGNKWLRNELKQLVTRTIGLILPVRHRPHNLPRFYKYWKKTTSGNSRIYLIMDDDDRTYDNIDIPKEFIVIRQPNMPTIPKINNVAMRIAEECEYIGFMADDVRLRTDGWEELVITKLNELGKYSMIYMNDMLQRHKLATHPVFTSELIKKVGYIGIPTLYHTMVDMGWMHLCTYLNKSHINGGGEYMPEIIAEHLHRDNKKAPDDALYKLAYSEEWLKHDRAEFNKYFPKQFYEDLKSLE